MALCMQKPTLALEENGFPTGKPSLIILNQPIPNVDLLHKLWQNSSFRICADGGANRLYDLFLDSLEIYRDSYLPERIHGDLDSLRPDVRRFYEKRGVLVTLDDDQYCTDFGKAFKAIDEARLGSTNNEDKHCWDQINVIGAISGRVDQGIGLLHEMLREQSARRQLSLFLFSDCSISCILEPGVNRIDLDISTGIITANIGILPIYGPATISTQGLEWDVEQWETKMGGNVSTSNHVVRKVAEITTDVKVLFTVERVASLPKWSSEIGFPRANK